MYDEIEERMVRKKDLNRVSEFEWEIPADYRKDMRGAVRIFITDRLLDSALEDLSLEQAVNAASLPGLAGKVTVMPDMHQGYGFPIGGVAATRISNGVISPGAIGYDINCGVRLLSSQIQYRDVKSVLPALADAIDYHCPSGVGSKAHLHLNEREIKDVCLKGAGWTLKKGFAEPLDLAHTEENGCLAGADPDAVSERAFERGCDQLGTLGSGNHFIEVDLVDEVFDPKAAGLMGIVEGYLVVQIHCGSRGFGHQICTDYVQQFQTAVRRYGITLPDRELVCAPVESDEGKAYLGAMRAAANYAFANRQILADNLRQAFEQTFTGHMKQFHLHPVYDVAHNMGKIETHNIDGVMRKVCVHRKGATRAFRPGTAGVPEDYQTIGQPVFVPGSMGTSSWVLTGMEGSMLKSFGSCCHGAGRTMSRHEAKKSVGGAQLKSSLEAQGIIIRAGSLAGLAEETPSAYKDVDAVIKVVCGAGLAKKVARLVPVIVVKG
jgi:tRNA-splicing ligase RtcB